MNPAMRRLCLMAAATVLLCGTTSHGAGPYDGYMNNDALVDAISELAQGSAVCRVATIGETGSGREIRALTLASDPDAADENPAILIVAGLDGRHMVGTETAIRVASRLLSEHSDLLDELTFYIIPRVNPDGTEINFGEVNAGYIGTLTDVDADRDAMMNENGPSDLNGDGVITQMRRPNPPLDDRAEFIADPVEPRLLKKPDAREGETAMYSVYIEGVDSDDDGKIAEDGDGSVDLDRNFMHEWPAFARDSGAYPLSEPEAMALATFVIEHENIVAAVVYGRHDNLINKPDSKGKDVSGRGPKVIDSGDANLYEQIGTLYTETTGQKRAEKNDTAGSFHAWLYAQRGIPSFATTVWGRPDPAKKQTDENGEDEDEEVDGNGDAETSETDAAPASDVDPVSGVWTANITIPEMGDMDLTLTLERADDDSVTGSMDMMMGTATLTGSFAPGSGALSLSAEFSPEITIPLALMIEGDEMTGTVTGPDGNATDLTGSRVSSNDAGGSDDAPQGEKKDKGKIKASDENAAAWLAYSDTQRDGAGFIEWTEYEHPTFGTIEIGGFVPGFNMNPPADQLDALANPQTDFIVKLTEKLPKLRVEGPTVKKLASGLYEIRLGVINDGSMPTKTAMARKARTMKPTIIRMSVPVEQIVTGNRVDRIWGLDGSGGRSVHHWIVRVKDGASLSIEIANGQFGEQGVSFKAAPTD